MLYAMSSKLLSEKALAVINQYQNFHVGFAVCSIPYYNNRRIKARARLRAQIGKGSPEDILDEAENVALAEKIKLTALDSISLKKFLVDKNIGIDCSGLVYYILKAEYGSVKLSFPFSKGILGMLRAKFRPIENAGVATLAHDSNTKVISLSNAVPGDMITMLGGPDNNDRDHVLVIHQIDYTDEIPKVIHYTHTVAWPSDGEYGHGVRQGTITITDPEKSLIDQDWMENNKIGEENYTFTRAQKSKTEIRRLNWL